MHSQILSPADKGQPRWPDWILSAAAFVSYSFRLSLYLYTHSQNLEFLDTFSNFVNLGNEGKRNCLTCTFHISLAHKGSSSPDAGLCLKETQEYFSCHLFKSFLIFFFKETKH